MAKVDTPDILANLHDQIDAFRPDIERQDIGTVLESGDGIARVSGLSNVRNAELVQFDNGSPGIVFNLEVDNVGIIVMGDGLHRPPMRRASPLASPSGHHCNSGCFWYRQCPGRQGAI